MSEMSFTDRKKMKRLAKTLSEQVEHLDETEIDGLILEFYDLLGLKERPGKESHGLDKERFQQFLEDMFELDDSLLMDGVFRAFDKDSDGFISLEEWIEGMSVYLRGTLKEKIKFCFCVYDLDGEQLISKNTVYEFLKDCFPRLPKEEQDEGVKYLMEIVFKKMDPEHTGSITLQTFEAAVNKEDLLLEAFGRCLPEASHIEKFEQRFRRN